MKRIVLLFLILASFCSCKKSSKDTTPNSPSPCSNGVQDNGETGVDCGGPCSACPKEWTVVTSGTTADLYSVHFIDENNGWAVGLNGTIIHSSDGGNNWSPQSSGITDTLNAVCFVSSSTGYIAGAHHILKTTNSGANWSIVSVDTTKTYYALHFFDANKGWIGGTNADWPFLDYTSTGGSVWLSKYLGQSNSQHGAIRSIEFVNELSGFAVGTDAMGLAIATPDGNSWTTVPMQFPVPLYGCSFSSQSDGWSVGNENFYYDAGSSIWRGQAFLPHDNILRAIKLVNTGTGWAVGDGGTVYKRTAQYEWTSVPNISTINNLYSVSVSGATGCIVGQNGVMYILR